MEYLLHEWLNEALYSASFPDAICWFPAITGLGLGSWVAGVSSTGNILSGAGQESLRVTGSYRNASGQRYPPDTVASMTEGQHRCSVRLCSEGTRLGSPSLQTQPDLEARPAGVWDLASLSPLTMVLKCQSE